MSTNSNSWELTPIQRDAYEEYLRWPPRGRDAREDRALALIFELRRNKRVHRNKLALVVGVAPPQVTAVVRDARVMACIGSGIAPAACIVAAGDGTYMLGEGTALLRWALTEAKHLASRSATLTRVLTFAGEPELADIAYRAGRACKRSAKAIHDAYDEEEVA